MAYEVVMSYHLHMPSYFLGTFTEYPIISSKKLPLLHMIVAGVILFKNNSFYLSYGIMSDKIRSLYQGSSISFKTFPISVHSSSTISLFFSNGRLFI